MIDLIKFLPLRNEGTNRGVQGSSFKGYNRWTLLAILIKKIKMKIQDKAIYAATQLINQSTVSVKVAGWGFSTLNPEP